VGDGKPAGLATTIETVSTGDKSRWSMCGDCGRVREGVREDSVAALRCIAALRREQRGVAR
jgi:hypothetical protein